MHFDEDGGWETVSREDETVWLFIPYDLAEDIWTERTAGANPSRLTLCRWMTANHLLLVALAKNPASDRRISRFQHDPRYMWVPVPAGSDLDLEARADHWELCHGPDDPFDEDNTPIVRTSIH
jgi:hypothetical protein